MRKTNKNPSFLDLCEIVEAHGKRIQRLESIKLPVANLDDVSALVVIMENHFGRKLTGKIWKNQKAVELAILLFRRGMTYGEVKTILKNVVGFEISRSSLARFWKRCQKFGIVT